MYVSNAFKKYDGYKGLKILEVTSILNIQKEYCSGFIKNIRCINPAQGRIQDIFDVYERSEWRT